MSQQEKNQPNSPPTFQDGAGRSWTLKLTLGLIEHVQESTGVDLLAESESSPLVGILFDQRKLSRVLWCCLEKQAQHNEVPRDDFIDSLDGEALTAGWEALFNAVLFFIPPQARAVVQANFDAQMAAVEQGIKAMVEVAESQETDQAIRQAIGKIKREMQADLPRQLASSVSS